MSNVTIVESNKVPNFFNFTDEAGNIMIVDVRAEGEETLFRASDVAKCLGYKNPSNFIELLEEVNLVKREVRNVDGALRQVPFLTEAQLYEGLMLSRAANAAKFRKWVCGIVLPSIRKTGSYSMAGEAVDPFAGLSPTTRAIVEIDLRIQEVKAQVIEVKQALEADKSIMELNTVQKSYIESLMAQWFHKCGKDGRLIGRMKKAIKATFIQGAANNNRWYHVAQKHYDAVVALVNQMGEAARP
jgi:prophage antirepressor-like protein